MNYLLDTNTCVEYLRLGANSRVAARIATTPVSQIYLCSVVLGEFFFGALRSSNPVKELQRIEAFSQPFCSLPFDDSAAQVYAVIRADLEAKGTRIGSNDSLIAAVSLANRLTLVTHNTKEFSRVTGLSLEDWQV